MDYIVTPIIRRKVFERDGYTCAYCGQKFEMDDLEVDHIHPKSKGGKNNFINFITACCKCNCKKSNQILENPPKVNNIELNSKELKRYKKEFLGENYFKKHLRITVKTYNYLKKIKGKKSMAAKADEIIKFYKEYARTIKQDRDNAQILINLHPIE
jgi:CRISPR/Cas system Type II protein with McrA/HNH and RuvC-like nuclease domain